MAIKFLAITMLQLKILLNMFVLQMLLIDMSKEVICLLIHTLNFQLLHSQISVNVCLRGDTNLV